MGTEKEYARLLQRSSTSTKSLAKQSVSDIEDFHDQISPTEESKLPRTIRSSTDMLRLQQAHGNQSVMRMVQAKRQGESQIGITQAAPNVVARLPQEIQDQVDKIDTKIKIYETLASVFGAGQQIVMAPAFIVDGIVTLIKSIFGKAEIPERGKDRSWRQKIKDFKQLVTTNSPLTMLLNGYSPDGQAIEVDAKIGSFKPLSLRNMPWNIFSWLARPFNWKARQLQKERQKLITKGSRPQRN